MNEGFNRAKDSARDCKLQTSLLAFCMKIEQSIPWSLEKSRIEPREPFLGAKELILNDSNCSQLLIYGFSVELLSVCGLPFQNI